MDPTDNTPQPGEHGPPANLDYEIVRCIGKGGYGEVWLVRDRDGEYRACKVVYRESFQNDRPYEREYEGICRFEPVSRTSQSQVRILYVGRRDAAGYFFYIMELADDASGAAIIDEKTYVPKTLQSELERLGRLPADECIRIGLSLSAALDNLHQHALIHRDVKPANVIFVQGIPKLADIGLVTEADVTVSYVGTGGFIPPEGPGSEKADVYGLGKTLYEISTGKDRMDYPELPASIGELPDRAQLLELNAVVARACEANAARRYASAAALRADLELLQGGRSIRQIRQSRRRWKLFGQFAGAAAVIAFAALFAAHRSRPQTKPVEMQIPTQEPVKVETARLDPADVAQNESRIREACRKQLANGSATARQQAAMKLIDESSLTPDPAAAFASLRVASLLAIKAGNYPLAMQICDKLGERFQTNTIPIKTELLGEGGEAQGKISDCAECCLAVGYEALADDDYDNAKKLAALALTAGRHSIYPRLVKEAVYLDRELARCGAAFKPVARFKEILQQKPGDPEANLAVGKYLCLVKNDWAAGLPLIERGNDDSFKAVLAGELSREPLTPSAEITLADAWRQLAESTAGPDQTGSQQRARYWYLKAIAARADEGIPGARLAAWVKTIPTEPAEIHIRTRANGVQTIDIYGDEIRWKCEHEAYNSRVNQALFGDLKTGDLKVLRNAEATRYMPTAVDFLSATMDVVRKPKKQARAKLEKAPDHIRITLSHPRSGLGETEITLTFGQPRQN